MKKALWLFVAFIAGVCLEGMAQTNAHLTETEREEEVGKVIEMSKALFVENILDYEGDSDTRKFKGDKPVVIDFYANWCVPCKLMSPVMKDLAKEYEGKVVFYKINGDKEKELTALFNIPAYPSFVFITSEGEVKGFRGGSDKATFRKIIDSFLLGVE